MKLATLVRKEARIILRSRLLLVVLVLYPLVIVGIIGYAFSQPNQRVPLAIVNEDVDAQGRPNVDVVRGPIQGETSGFEVSTTDIIRRLEPFADPRLADRDEALRLLLTGEVQAVLRFPPNFVRDIANLESNGRLEVIIDQSDPVRAKFMEVVIRGVVQEFQEQIVSRKVELILDFINRSLEANLAVDDPLYPGFRGVQQRLQEIRDANPQLTPEHQEALNDSIAFLATVVETLGNARGIVNSVAQPIDVAISQERSGSLFIRDLVVPAAIALGIFWTGSLATSSLVVYERESAAYTRLRITPATAWAIYGSKIVVTLAIILAQSLLILGVALLAWNTRVDNPALTLLVILVSTLASMGLGLFLAGISRDVNGTVLLSVLVTFPMLFLAGLFYPVDFMPRGAQLLAGLFPLTYAVEALRGAMLRGFTLSVASHDLAVLALFGAALTILGVALGKRLELRR